MSANNSILSNIIRELDSNQNLNDNPNNHLIINIRNNKRYSSDNPCRNNEIDYTNIDNPENEQRDLSKSITYNMSNEDLFYNINNLNEIINNNNIPMQKSRTYQENENIPNRASLILNLNYFGQNHLETVYETVNESNSKANSSEINEDPEYISGNKSPSKFKTQKKNNF